MVKNISLYCPFNNCTFMQAYFLLSQILHEIAIYYILRGTVLLTMGRENAKVLYFGKSLKLSVSGSVYVLCKICLKLDGTGNVGGGGVKCIKAKLFLQCKLLYVQILRLSGTARRGAALTKIFSESTFFTVRSWDGRFFFSPRDIRYNLRREL
jgi:hypothetical protein